MKPRHLLLITGLLCASSALPQTSMPSDEALKKAMDAARAKAATALDSAASQAQPSTVTPQRIVPDFSNSPAGGVDPARIAEQYRTLGKPAETDNPELIVFVSLSMPEESLKRIGEQAKRAGAVVAFRGLKYGLRNGGWNRSMEALKPVADTGADVQIHPELFARYNVRSVPTLVVASSPKQGCQEDACEAQSAAVAGDVSLDYALDHLADRRDEIGRIARERLKRLRNS